MTNETIVRMYPRPDPKNMECALDLARADEREKMQGVDVWISVNAHREAIIEFYMNRPTPNSWIYNNLTDDSDRLIELLKLQSGECAKFKIVRCE